MCDSSLNCIVKVLSTQCTGTKFLSLPNPQLMKHKIASKGFTLYPK